MKASAHRHRIVVGSKAPPTVEVDTDAVAVYVRFKRAKIARTESRPADEGNLAIDFDENGEVVGVEAIGFRNFNVRTLLAKAAVEAPHANLDNCKYMPAHTLVPA